MKPKIYSGADTIKIIEELSKKGKVPYKHFKQIAETFFDPIDYPAASQTIWRGQGSKNSLSFGEPIQKDRYKAREILSRVFNINNNLFKEKYEQAISGDGQEWKRITTMTSSSLIALLCFYNISEERPLKLYTDKGVVVLTSSKFEVKNPIPNSRSSNIDVVLSGYYESRPQKKVYVLMESKFSEYLKNGKKGGDK